MLLCKQTGCCWHLVYINSPSTAASRCHAYEGDEHVQNCFSRPRAFRHPVRPPDGQYRLVADEQRPDRYPQRRPPILRPLKALGGASALASGRRFKRSSLTNSPGFSGAFFAPCSNCRRQSRCGIFSLRPCSALNLGITNTRMAPLRSHKRSALGEVL